LHVPKLTQSAPKYRLHRPSGQAVVTINGRQIYLGPHGSKASTAEYDRVIGEWLAGGRQLAVSIVESVELTINELLARFWR